MTSIAGGFLVGFGLCLLLVSFGASIVLDQYHTQLIEWRSKVEETYNNTHSRDYLITMEALAALSPYATQIADTLSLVGLEPLANYTRQIPRAATLMEQAYNLSEAAYYTMQNTLKNIGMVSTYLQYGMISGLLLIVVGVILIVRARKRSSRTKE
ncbi:MAG: hypothetical protein QXS89_05175 [Sulfolobales archaeon]